MVNLGFEVTTFFVDLALGAACGSFPSFRTQVASLQLASTLFQFVRGRLSLAVRCAGGSAAWKGHIVIVFLLFGLVDEVLGLWHKSSFILYDFLLTRLLRSILNIRDYSWYVISRFALCLWIAFHNLMLRRFDLQHFFWFLPIRIFLRGFVDGTLRWILETLAASSLPHRNFRLS